MRTTWSCSHLNAFSVLGTAAAIDELDATRSPGPNGCGAAYGGGVGTPVTQQLQTFQTGVTLDITPQVGPAGNDIVALHPVVNSLEGILNSVPQIATRDTQTVVQLDDNQTLVIGGLIRETSSRTVSKIPLLGDIPLVGSCSKTWTRKATATNWSSW